MWAVLHANIGSEYEAAYIFREERMAKKCFEKICKKRDLLKFIDQEPELQFKYSKEYLNNHACNLYEAAEIVEVKDWKGGVHIEQTKPAIPPEELSKILKEERDKVGAEALPETSTE